MRTPKESQNFHFIIGGVEMVSWLERVSTSNIAHWIIFLVMAISMTIVLIFVGYHAWGQNAWVVDIVKAHFAVTMGLPIAASASTLVLTMFKGPSNREHDAPLEIEGLGFKFKGASAPVLLWIICFVSIAACMKMLW